MIHYLPKLVSIIFIIISCSLPYNRVSGKNARIVGGLDATQSQFPYQVSIRWNQMHKCGGVIISKNYILTSARCVVKNFNNEGVTTYTPEDFNIRVGSINLYHSGLLVDVTNIVVHASYNNMLNDLALLKLKEPLIYSDYIKAITLPHERLEDNSMVSVMGWGSLKSVGDISRDLQWLEMQVVEPIKCFSNIFGENAENKILCLQSPANYGICNGDMGGAAVNENILVGLSSFAIERCGSEYPDGFTNIAYYVDWIKTNSDLL